jgi:DNA-binding NarL/FixJ family response regulator
MKKITITRKETMQIATEAQVDPRTVTRIYSGATSKLSVYERVVAAAKKLKITIP